jgi:hypothetical protein
MRLAPKSGKPSCLKFAKIFQRRRRVQSISTTPTPSSAHTKYRIDRAFSLLYLRESRVFETANFRPIKGVTTTELATIPYLRSELCSGTAGA